jgi:putative endonuclease
MNIYVYIVECRDGSYYTGVTNDVHRRLFEHNEGTDSKAYTYSRRPVRLAFTENFGDPRYAIAAEKRIKGWTRRKKEALIAGDWETIQELAECKNETHHRNLNNG